MLIHSRLKDLLKCLSMTELHTAFFICIMTPSTLIFIWMTAFLSVLQGEEGQTEHKSWPQACTKRCGSSTLSSTSLKNLFTSTSDHSPFPTMSSSDAAPPLCILNYSYHQDLALTVGRCCTLTSQRLFFSFLSAIATLHSHACFWDLRVSKEKPNSTRGERWAE